MVDEHIRRVLEVMPGPVILIREDGTIAFANDQTAKLLGYGRDNLIDLPLKLLVPERFRDRHARHITASFAKPLRPTGGGMDLWALCRDGREVAVDFTLSLFETVKGTLAVATIRDISAHKKVEFELRDALAKVDSLQRRLQMENLYLREEIKTVYGFDEFVGKSDVLKFMLDKIEKVARSDATVLILGETGTGKELVARAIHDHSGRKDHPLVKVNCAALPSSLIESELFGHEKGAFTGASIRAIGRFELAGSGTIFLDEIGDLELNMQTKLLRVLQEGQFERVGSARTLRANARVLAATNRDLHGAMLQGRFRADLYFRLAVFPIEVPPLRVRQEDIPLLVWYFVAKKQARLGSRIENIPQTTMARFMEYPWPGNIRELENVIERSMILSSGSTLIAEALLAPVPMNASVPDAKSAGIENVMRRHILGVLQDCQWRIKGNGAAADRLGMNPSTLRYRMRKLGIKRL